METWTTTCGPIPGGLILTHTQIATAAPLGEEAEEQGVVLGLLHPRRAQGAHGGADGGDAAGGTEPDSSKPTPEFFE